MLERFADYAAQWELSAAERRAEAQLPPGRRGQAGDDDRDPPVERRRRAQSLARSHRHVLRRNYRTHHLQFPKSQATEREAERIDECLTRAEGRR